MHDQADDLRQLARQTALERPLAGSRGPWQIAVAGAKGGVGATTMAVNLAVALARQGNRTILVDANLQRPDVAKLCTLEERDTIADVLCARRTVHEVLQVGPPGVSVLPGAWTPEQVVDCSPSSQTRLLEQLAGLGPFADAIVLDVGSGLSHVTRRFWTAANLVLLVTTGEVASVMDAYAAIKVLLGNDAATPVRTLANMVPNALVAAEVHGRIAHASRRFLGRRVESAGYIPPDPVVAAAAQAGRPFAVQAPECRATQHIEAVAVQVARNEKTTDSIQPLTPHWSIGEDTVGTRSAVKMEQLHRV
jgi:flagellar biosynthesis protein FlhG